MLRKLKTGVGAGILLLLAALMLLMPVTGRAASKRVMPRKMTEYRKSPEYDDYRKEHIYTISYDGKGRIQKIKIYSDITDAEWNYTFTYKKSGKKTVVTSNCRTDEGLSRKKITFLSSGLLEISSRGKSCSWSFHDKKKTKPSMLIVGSDVAYTFTKKGVPETFFFFENLKYSSCRAYTSKSGKITKATGYDWSVPVEQVTQASLKKADVYRYKYTTTTKKISMSDAVYWMDMGLLLEYVY